MNIPFTPGQTVYVIENVENYHYETRKGGWDHLGPLPDEEARVSDGYEKRVTKESFYYGLLDDYDVDEIFTSKTEAEKEMRKAEKYDFISLGKIVSFAGKEGSYRICAEKIKGSKLEGILLSGSAAGKRVSVDLDNKDILSETITICKRTEHDMKIVEMAIRKEVEEEMER